LQVLLLDETQNGMNSNEDQARMDQYVQSLWWFQPSKQVTNHFFQICYEMSPESFGLK
jgi:hypothetical protein